MSTPTLAQLLTPVTPDQVFAQELEVAGQLGLPETAWQAISIGREILYVNGTIVSNWSTAMTGGPVAGGFLTYASGDWLTLCAQETFDTTRTGSSFATGLIGLSNSTALPYVFTAGGVRVLDQSNGMTYTCTTGGTVPAQVGITPGTLAVQFSADQPGSKSNLISGDPLSLVTMVPGVTPYWIANLVGQDTESDDALKIRARQANAKASPNGPGDAYEYFAKTTVRADGTNVGVTRTNKVQGNGTVTLYLANADGPLITADHNLVLANVNAQAVPTGFTLFIPDPSCSTLTIPVTVTLTQSPASSTSRTAIETNIKNAIISYFSTIPVGGDQAQSFQGVYASTLVQLIRNAGGSDVLNVVMTAPTDQALSPDQIPTLGAFTPAWTV